jgi:lipoprotein-anchoring transpeptidase ErfK/SrfK
LKVMHRPGRRLLALAAAAAIVTVPAAARAVTIPKRDEAVTIKRYLLGRVVPKIGARGTVHLWTNTGYSNRRAVYPVISHKVLEDGSEWLKVRVVRRPRGVDTWVPAWATRQVWIDWHLVVDLSSRTLRVYRGGKLARRFRVVVGAPGTPTPSGHFYVVDHMRLYNSWAHGVWALATSAYSAKLKHFDGGDGVVALHGRGYLAAPVGTAASHGCVRLNNGDVAWLAKHIPNGTRLDIQR